ncbi:MAG: SHOCT domain-containing protein [Dermatophilaceae bacterium]
MFDNNGSFLLALFEFFIFFAYLMCLFWIFSDLFRSRDLGGWSKTFWILLIIVVPILGMLIYLIARGGGMTQRAIESRQELQKAQVQDAQGVVASQGGVSVAGQIASAKGLLDSGAISQAEFDQLKAKALAS